MSPLKATSALKQSLLIAIVAILAVVSLLILRGGCRSSSKDQLNLRPVRLAYIPYSADLPFFVAIEKGYFGELGIAVEPIPCKSSSEALDLVLAGKADGAMGNSFSVLFSIHAKNSDTIRLINVSLETADQDRFTGFALVGPDSVIDSPSLLQGKTIGTEKGASQLLWVKLYLSSLGIDPVNDVRIEQEAPETLLNALHAGQIDALFVFEPYATIGLTKGLAKPLQPFFRRSIINPFPAGGATLSRDFCAKEPAAADKVIEAIDRAIDLINHQPEEAKLALLPYVPLDRETALKSQIYLWWGSSEIRQEPVQKLADIMAENDQLASRIDVSTFIR